MIFRRAYVEIISGMEGKESCLTKQMWKWDGSQKEKMSGEEIALKINHFIIQTNKPKVASSNKSCLEAHAGFFRLLMKRIFDPYVLWPFEKKKISKLLM
jgi:hypothetical protein